MVQCLRKIRIVASGGIDLLYVIHVRTGSELTTIEECRCVISRAVLKDVYTPKKLDYYKLDGKWITREKILFPGYIFVETDLVTDFFYELRKVTRFATMVRFEKDLICVNDEEMYLIQKLSGKEKIMGVSEGVLVGEKIHVVSGPLVGLEGLIIDFDRHKRKAWIETEMFGCVQKIKVALELVRKIEE